MMNNVPAHIYKTTTVMKQGTGVKRAPDNSIVPALDGLNVIGLLAQDVINWADRPREADLFPEYFIGKSFPYNPVYLQRPGQIAGTFQDGGLTNVGVWMEENSMFQTEINDDAGNPVHGLLPGQPLEIGVTGFLEVPAVGSVRPVVAVIEDSGYTSLYPGNNPAMGYPINTSVATYMIRLLELSL
jgi:hypothetical protein